MLLYVDAITGGELCTDSFKIVEEHDGAIWSIASKRVVKGDVDVDIGCGNAFGGNADEDEALPAGAETVIDIVDAHGLVQITYGRKEYKILMKKYYKDLKTALKKRLSDAKESGIGVDDAKAAKKKFNEAELTKIMEFVKTVVDKFDEYDFYTPTPSREYQKEHGDKDVTEAPSKLIIPASYPDGAITPTFHIIATGVRAVKY